MSQDNNDEGVENNSNINTNEKKELKNVSKSKEIEAPFYAPKRNIQLLRFFKNIFPNNEIRLVGNENNPAVVIDFETKLSCYVSNFDVRFNNKNIKGDVLFEVKLKEKFEDIKVSTKKVGDVVTEIKFDKLLIDDWYKNNQHGKMFRVYLECESTQSPLYLVGWNYKNKVTKQGKYPIFAEYEPFVYFTKQKPLEIQEELIQMGYNVIVI